MDDLAFYLSMANFDSEFSEHKETLRKNVVHPFICTTENELGNEYNNFLHKVKIELEGYKHDKYVIYVPEPNIKRFQWGIGGYFEIYWEKNV
jgi:hypothetical protein